MTSPLYIKSSAFADRILDMSDYLLSPREQWQQVTVKGKTFNKKVKLYPKYSVEVCVKQVTRSGTSIAANIAESRYAQSEDDMKSKFSIALKEASETQCWLERLLHRKAIEQSSFDSMNNDVVELIKMLTSSINTLKNKKSK